MDNQRLFPNPTLVPQLTAYVDVLVGLVAVVAVAAVPTVGPAAEQPGLSVCGGIWQDA